MLKLGELVAYIKGDKSQLDRDLVASQMEFRAAGAQMAKDADSAGRAMGENLGAGGKTGGERFTTDAAGKLRDSRGRFVKEGEQLGRGLGDGLGDGVKNNTGWLSSVQGAVRSMGGAFSSAKDWVQSTSKQVGNFAGNVSSAVGSVVAIVQVLAMLGAVATFAAPAVGLLGGALGALPALSVGVGAGIGVLVLGFMGLTDQFKKHTAAGGAVVDKAWQIAQAERRVRDANVEVLASQEALTRSRETAAKRMDDLNRSLRGAHVDERGAVLAVADAEKALADARRTGSRSDVDHAQQALDQAVQSLEDIRARIQDMEAEQKRNAQTGVEGSDEVKAAYDRQRKAVEGVTDAQHALAEAQKPASGGGGAADDIMKIAPAAAAAVAVIKQLKPAFDSLRLDVQQRLFAGVSGEIRSLADAWLPTLHSKLGQTATTFNGLIKTFSTEAKKPEFIDNIGKGLDSVNRLIDKVGGAVAGPLVDAFGRLSKAASPFLDAAGDEVSKLVTDFSAWIKQADQSGDLKDFFKKASDFLHDVFGIGRDVGSILGDIASVAFGQKKKGDSAWDSFKKTMDDLAAWFKDPENKKTIENFFEDLKISAQAVLLISGWIAGLIVWIEKAQRKLDEWGGQLLFFATKSVPDAFDKAVKWVEGLPGRISKASSGMWDGIKDSFKSAINWVIGRWNGLHFAIGGGSFMGVPIPQSTLNVPKIPMLKDGGVVRATPGGRMVGVAEGGEDEAVIPLSKLAGMMRGQQITVKFDTNGDTVLDTLFTQFRWKVQGEYSGNVNDALGGKA